MRSTRTRQAFIGLCFVLLVAIMFVLIGGLQTIELLPGKPFPTLPPPGEVRGIETAPPEPWAAEAIIPVMIQVLLIFGLAASVIFAVISPEFRRYLAILAGVIALILFVFSRIEPGIRPIVPLVEEGAAGLAEPGAPASPEPVRVEIPPVHAPEWGVIMAAIGIALVVAGIGLFVMLRLYPLLKKRRKDRNLLLDQLGELASDAVARIRAGDDPRQVVLHCYKEMSDIISYAEKIPNFSHFTPREFAQSLRSRGMSDDHVDRLTGIFEQVRYGGRQGRGFADEALLSLEAIERTYARGAAA